jgi:uncharacterized protein (DUF2252 family)
MAKTPSASLSPDVVSRIQRFHQHLPPDRVQLKYELMAQNAFEFLRGTCHLFYEDWATHGAGLDAAPAAWICGDLHWQNFGSYKGDDRLAYFDINDFDEGLLAPCSLDLARFLTSIWIGGPTLGAAAASADHCQALCETWLTAYTQALSLGKARSVQRETATGLVGQLLKQVSKRDRPDFLDGRTTQKGGKRQLKIVKGKTEATTKADRAAVKTLIHTWAQTQSAGLLKGPDFFKVLDVAHRIAGNGSLGVERYLVLVEGKGNPDGNFLLDLKAARASSLAPYVKTGQPNWGSQADRAVNLQFRCQESPPALLSVLTDGAQSYVLRELQPTADRISLANCKPKALHKALTTMAEVTAWSHLRSGGRQGSAIADAMIDFAASADQWQVPLLDYARDYAQQVTTDFQTFRAAWDAGSL